MGELQGILGPENQNKSDYWQLYYGVIYAAGWKIRIWLVFLPKTALLEMKV